MVLREPGQEAHQEYNAARQNHDVRCKQHPVDEPLTDHYLGAADRLGREGLHDSRRNLTREGVHWKHYCQRDDQEIDRVQARERNDLELNLPQ